MQNSIIKKLAAGFGLCLLLIITVVGYNYYALRKLENLYQETLKRSRHLELAMHSQHIGKELYQIIADAIINRDLAQSERDWVVCKKDSLDMLNNMNKAVETLQEQANVREAEKAIHDIIRIYELEMLPLIHKGATLTGRLPVVDSQLDKRITTIDLALQRVTQSMSKKNQKAEWEYHVVRNQTHAFGLMISLAGVLAILAIISLMTRQIVVPLHEITSAAVEIKKGNYLIGLKHVSNDEIGVLSDAFRDMSKQVEKRTHELQEAHNELEQRVAQRTSELTDTNTRLKQEIIERERLEQQLFSAKKLESIGQLAGGVAHEVRNPLNAILTITEALFREKELENNPEYEPYIKHIRTQVSRLAQLMNDLLELGKTIPASSLQPASLYDLCNETIMLWKSSGSAKNKQIVLECDEHSDRLLVITDSIKLQQVFFNLIENAAQHNPPANCVRFSILGLDSPYNERGMAIVHISDEGKGILPDRIRRIFEPFYSDRKGGTGLGLALVKHFIENMGGTVRIWNNVPPPGCTAEIRIPLASEERA